MKTLLRWRFFCTVLIALLPQWALAYKPSPPDGGSPVYEAIKRGDRAEALRLIATKARINEFSQAGLTPLFQAMWRRDDELVDALLKNGADPHKITRHDRSSLNLAASVGSLSLVKKLHALGVDPDPRDPPQHSALWNALCNTVPSPSSMPHTPGAYASDDERWQVVAYLIPLTNVRTERDPEYRTLHCAAMRAPARIVAELLKRGAPIPPPSRLFGPILFQPKDVDVMRLLVEHGADVHERDQEGRNLLHLSGERNVAIARFLLECGVDVNARDKNGQVPLFSAIRNTDLTVTELLLKHGADINALGHDGGNIVFAAARTANLASMTFLLKRGVNPRVRNKRGETPVHAALNFPFNNLTSEQVAITRLLLQNRVDANALDASGTAALHIAALRLDESSLEVLLTHGARVGITDKLGRTALHVAAGVPIQSHKPMPAGMTQPNVDQPFVDEQLSRKLRAIQMLLRHGADKTARDKSSRRPVDLLGTKLEQALKPVLD